MQNYTQLTESERNQIYALKQAGFKPSAIALQLNRHPQPSIENYTVIADIAPDRRSGWLKTAAAKRRNRKSMQRRGILLMIS